MNKTPLNQPALIMLYGFPGSGKTYFARSLSENLSAAHIQGDRIRFELFEKPRNDKQENEIIEHLMEYMAEEFLNAGVSVVFDTNAARLVQRRALRDIARRSNAQPLLIWLQIDAESAYLRISKRDRRRADDKYAIDYDKNSFKEAASHMQNPATTEDYMVISGKHTFNTQRSAVAKKLYDMGLVTGAEASSQLVKPGMINLVPSRAAGRVDISRRNIIIR